MLQKHNPAKANFIVGINVGLWFPAAGKGPPFTGRSVIFRGGGLGRE